MVDMPRVSDMKARLTDAALDLMWENSYGTTSVDAICERAGAKKGKLLLFLQVEIRADRRCARSGMEQEQDEHGRPFFSNRSAARTVRSVF